MYKNLESWIDFGQGVVSEFSNKMRKEANSKGKNKNEDKRILQNDTAKANYSGWSDRLKSSKSRNETRCVSGRMDFGK
jgi:hypothetical protein